MGTLYNVDANTGDTTIAGQILGKRFMYPAFPATSINGNQTVYVAWHGMYTSANEASVKIFISKCKVKRIELYVSTNSLGDNTTITLRKNAEDTSAVITIPAGGTGRYYVDCDVQFEAEDELSIRITLGGTTGQNLVIKGGNIWLEL